MIRRITILVLVGTALLVGGAWIRDSIWLGVGGWTIRFWQTSVSGDGYALYFNWGHPGRDVSSYWDFHPFSYASGPSWLRFDCPYWFPLLVFLAYPVLRFVRVRWWSRRRDDRWLADECLSCSYSLKGPAITCCPECGELCDPSCITIQSVRRRQVLDLILLCVALGVLDGMVILSWVLGVTYLVGAPYWSTGRVVAQLVEDLVGFVPSGLLTGAVLCLIAVPLLFRKPIQRVFRPLVVALILATCVELLVLTVLFSNSPIISTPLPICVFLVMCMVLRRKLSDVHTPGHCGKCEYDLTANESGVCPECGKAI